MKHLWRLHHGKRLIGLVYHLVAEEAPAHLRHITRYKDPRQFSDDLLFLRTRLLPISYRRLLRAREEGDALPSRPAFLSFDDGHSECYSVARPLLIRHRIPAVFFITTDFIDNRRMFFRHKLALCLEKLEEMDGGEAEELLRKIAGKEILEAGDRRRALKALDSRSAGMIDRLCQILGVDTDLYLTRKRPYLTSGEIRDLAKDGFTIGAHGKTHRRLSLLPPEEREEEVVGSCRRIREITEQEFVPFAFPFDGRGLEPSWLRDILSRHRFVRGFFDSCLTGHPSDLVTRRILADSPSRSKPGRSNLGRLIARGCFNPELTFRRRALLTLRSLARSSLSLFCCWPSSVSVCQGRVWCRSATTRPNWIWPMWIPLIVRPGASWYW